MGKFCEDVVQVEFRNWLQDVTCLQMFKRCLTCWDFSPYCGGGGGLGLLLTSAETILNSHSYGLLTVHY